MLKDKSGRPLTFEEIRLMWADAKMSAGYEAGMPDPLGDKAANQFYEALAVAEARGATDEEIEAITVPMPTWTVWDELTHRLNRVPAVLFAGNLIRFFTEDSVDYSSLSPYG